MRRAILSLVLMYASRELIRVQLPTRGNYKLRVPSLKDAVLVYSFIGMSTKEVKPTL